MVSVFDQLGKAKRRIFRLLVYVYIQDMILFTSTRTVIWAGPMHQVTVLAPNTTFPVLSYKSLNVLRFPEEDVFAQLERYGALPLPPYIEHQPGVDDETRYQTVFARTPGAVAAPTAGLHFDAALLGALRDQGIGTAYLTLHVGAGTFQPVRTQNLIEHRMHSEWYSLSQQTVDAINTHRAAGGRIVAVGTTSLRALESAAAVGDITAGSAETSLFVLPGYRFRVVDRLITNFHLPKSTLLMLVSAFGGFDNIRNAYRHAIEQRYRFFSYGDAMLIDRAA